MFQKLVSHNDDLSRLVEGGFAVAFADGYLIIRDVPYLDSTGELQWGAIVTKLEHIDECRVQQSDHQVFFAGSAPHGMDGQPIPNLGGGAASLPLGEGCGDVVVQRSFSNKPREAGRFADFDHKIRSYVTIIAGPAIEKFGASPYTFRAVKEVRSESVFKFQDTMTSRAEIGDLSARLKNDVVAVIGLGGTGAYVLDFLIKTPVREIRAFDPDPFHVHNAFRSPGRLVAEELGRPKADVYGDRYDNFRAGLSCKAKFIDGSSKGEIEGVTFAFVCVDKGSSRAAIFDLLLANRVPFIDVGMGLKRKADGPLDGMARTTFFSEADAPALVGKGLAELTDRPADLYRQNIQLSELNALNACLAVLRFKQLRGFYADDRRWFHLLYNVRDTSVVGESDVRAL